MGEKRMYTLKNQRMIQSQDSICKTCCCILLVMLAICGIIALTAFLVNHLKSKESKSAQTNYQNTGESNSEMFQTGRTNGIKNDYTFSTVDNGNGVGSSKVSEFTDTTIESPLSTSTVSSNTVSPRFLFVNTLDTSNSDNIITKSTNEYVRVTSESIEEDITKRTTASNLFNDDPAGKAMIDFLNEWLTSVRSDDAQVTNDDRITDNYSTPKNKYEIQSNKCSNSLNEENCLTSACKQSASRMLALIDHAVDPCEDFYSYACGGFDINHFNELNSNDEILESMPDIATLDLEVPYNKVYHDFFTSCTNYKNGNGLKEASKFLYDLCQNHKDDLTDLLADIIMLHPQKSTVRLLPLFDITLEIGPKKTLVPTLSLPKLKSPLVEDTDMDVYERACLNSIKFNADKKLTKSQIQQSYKECLRNHTQYFKNLEKSIFLLQIFEHLTDFRKVQMIKKTLEFIEWNIITDFGSVSEEEIHNDKTQTVGLNWLVGAYPQIDWMKLLTKLFGEQIVKDITEIRMRHATHLVKIFKFYKLNMFEDIKTSLLSMMAHDMYMDFIEPQSTCDRYKYCQNIAKSLMPDIASKLLLEKLQTPTYFSVEENFNTMFNELIHTFNKSVDSNAWMNFDDKMKNFKTISALKLVSDPYATFFSFEKTYQKLYKEVNISSSDYISNVFALKQVIRKRMYATHGKSAESPDIIWKYLTWPISTSLTRVAETETIVLPAGVIRRFTKGGQNKFEEYAVIGFYMAREISPFLQEMKTAYTNVKKNEGFPPAVEIHMNDPAYSKKPNIFGIKLDEQDVAASQNARFADDLSLRITLNTYTSYVTSDKSFPWTNDSIAKLFYIIHSQQFCKSKKTTSEMAISLIHYDNLPSYFRVNSMMMNSEHFLNTFECSYGRL